MTSQVFDRSEVRGPTVRRKAVSAHNEATMRTRIDVGEYGTLTTDEPVAHGGTGQGPSPLQTVLGALGGRESVTFNRTAKELDFAYESLDFEARSPVYNLINDAGVKLEVVWVRRQPAG